MKEAAGEANMTVITIVLIAIVLAVGTILVTRMMGSTAKKGACSEIGGTLNGDTCTYTDHTGESKTCTVTKCLNADAYSCGTVVACPQ